MAYKDLTNVKAISMGGNAGAALKNDGNVVIWGHTNYGGTPYLYSFNEENLNLFPPTFGLNLVWSEI